MKRLSNLINTTELINGKPGFELGSLDPESLNCNYCILFSLLLNWLIYWSLFYFKTQMASLHGHLGSFSNLQGVILFLNSIV